jgi:hypothetical protein
LRRRSKLATGRDAVQWHLHAASTSNGSIIPTTFDASGSQALFDVAAADRL